MTGAHAYVSLADETAITLSRTLTAPSQITYQAFFPEVPEQGSPLWRECLLVPH